MHRTREAEQGVDWTGKLASQVSKLVGPMGSLGPDAYVMDAGMRGIDSERQTSTYSTCHGAYVRNYGSSLYLT